MVRVDMRITLARQRKIEARPESRERQHVIEQAEARLDGGPPTALKTQRQRNVRFRRGAGNLPFADHAPSSCAALAVSGFVFFLPTAAATQMLIS